MCKKFVGWILKGIDIKKTILTCAVFFLSCLLVFPAGIISSKTVNETCADYFAEIATNHIVFRGDKKLSGLIVEPKKEKGTQMRYDTSSAITELWGVFKGNNASYAPVMNANRDHDIYFSDQNLSSESLSLVYSNVGQSASPYHIDKTTKQVIDYKFQSSPIALMFSSSLSGYQDKLHIYISQSQAERKLKSMGVSNITYEDLQSLQKTTTGLIINGTSYECVIDNIYLDNFDHSYHFSDYDYYYATDVGTVIGDFVFVILYANKENVFPSDLTRQSLYIMSNHSFRNSFYLKYAKESYDKDGYSFDYARYNLIDGFAPNDAILKSAINNDSSDVGCILLVIFSFLLLFAGGILSYRYKLLTKSFCIFLISAFAILPYLIFKVISLVTNSGIFLSFFSLTIYIIMLSLLYVYIFVISINRKR